MKKIIFVLLFSGLTTFCSRAQIADEAGSIDSAPIKIGFITDLSGKAAYLGNNARIGAELAAEEINQKSRKVELVFGDHGMEPSRAVTEAQKLLNVDQVSALYSTFSGTSRAAAPVADKAGRLFVYAAAAMSPVKDNSTAFKSYLNFESGCRDLAQEWKGKGINKVAILLAESEFGQLCEKGALAVFPQALVKSYKLGEDVNTQAIYFKTNNIEAVFNAGLEGDMINMLKASERVNFYPVIGANEDVFTEKVIASFPKSISKISMFGMPKPSKEFIELVKSKEKQHELRAFDSAGMAYLHIKQIYNSLISCRDKGLECQVESLKKSPADSRFGFQGWSENRQAIYQSNLGGAN